MSCSKKDAVFAAMYGAFPDGDCNLLADVDQIKRNTVVLDEIVDAKNFRIAYQTADGEWK